jgi:seryl-tRNA synthetase
LLGNEVNGVRESFKQVIQRHGVFEKQLLTATDLQNNEKNRFQQHLLVLLKSTEYVAQQEHETRPIRSKYNQLATIIQRLKRGAVDASILAKAVLVLTGIKNKLSGDRETKKAIETQISSLHDLIDPNVSQKKEKKENHPNKYNASPPRSSQTYQPISMFDTNFNHTMTRVLILSTSYENFSQLTVSLQTTNHNTRHVKIIISNTYRS